MYGLELKDHVGPVLNSWLREVPLGRLSEETGFGEEGGGAEADLLIDYTNTNTVYIFS